MIFGIIAFVQSLFKKDESTSSLDAYIASNDPKTVDDVERLEREYLALSRYNKYNTERYY